jgi:hypothetical protein
MDWCFYVGWISFLPIKMAWNCLRYSDQLCTKGSIYHWRYWHSSHKKVREWRPGQQETLDDSLQFLQPCYLLAQQGGKKIDIADQRAA